MATVTTKHFILLTLLALALPLWGQQEGEQVDYAIDSSCGCQVVFVDGIQTTQDGELFGFRQADGKLIAPNKYKYVDKFRDGFCRVWLDYGYNGIINRRGQEIVPCRYEEAYRPVEGFCLVKDTLHYGFYDTLGNLRIPCRYRAASTFSEGLAVVAIDIDSYYVAYGFIDTTGTLAIAPQYQYANAFSEGYAVVKQYDRYGMIDHQGREVVPCKYEVLSDISQGLFFGGSEDEGFALFGPYLKPLTDFRYQAIVSIGNRRICAKRDGKYGYLDPEGNEVIPFVFDNAYTFSQGFAAVSQEGKWGIVDTAGRFLLPVAYDHSGIHSEAYCFHDGWALIEKDHHYGYVDTLGNFIYFNFTDAFQFSNGLAPVKGDQWGYIDTQGNVVVPMILDLASPFQWGRAQVFYLGKEFDIDTQGRCVHNCHNAPETWKR